MSFLSFAAGATDRGANEYSKFANRNHTASLQEIRDNRLAGMESKEWKKRYDTQRTDKVADDTKASKAAVGMKLLEYSHDFAIEEMKANGKSKEQMIDLYSDQSKNLTSQLEDAEYDADLREALTKQIAEIDGKRAALIKFGAPNIDYGSGKGGTDKSSTSISFGAFDTSDSAQFASSVQKALSNGEIKSEEARQLRDEWINKYGNPNAVEKKATQKTSTQTPSQEETAINEDPIPTMGEESMDIRAKIEGLYGKGSEMAGNLWDMLRDEESQGEMKTGLIDSVKTSGKGLLTVADEAWEGGKDVLKASTEAVGGVTKDLVTSASGATSELFKDYAKTFDGASKGATFANNKKSIVRAERIASRVALETGVDAAALEQMLKNQISGKEKIGGSEAEVIAMYQERFDLNGAQAKALFNKLIVAAKRGN